MSRTSSNDTIGFKSWAPLTRNEHNYQERCQRSKKITNAKKAAFLKIMNNLKIKERGTNGIILKKTL